MTLIDREALLTKMMHAQSRVNAMQALDRFTDTKMRQQWEKAIDIIDTAPAATCVACQHYGLCAIYRAAPQPRHAFACNRWTAREAG